MTESDGSATGGADHGHDDMLTWRAGAERVLTLRERVLDRLDTEECSLDSIAGRTLSEPIVAEADSPPESFATMDGYAIDATESYPLIVHEGDVFPEDTAPAIEAGEAIPIATGAPLPAGANAVLKREEATVEDGELTGTAIEPGTYVYAKASNVAAGETLFASGDRLSPKDAILLGDLGRETVPVKARITAGVLATGTEIHEGRSQDLDSPMLAGLVRSWGGEATYEGSVPDDRDQVVDRIAALADRYDVVITTGGTSVGKKDYVISALEELGDVLFHRVKLRPGKPIAVADLPEHDAVALAIPGKPIGAHAVTTLVARPLFSGDISLPSMSARIDADVELPVEGFAYAIPVTIANDGTLTNDAANRVATPLGQTGSGLSVYDRTFNPSVLSSSTRASRADGFVLTESGLSADESVDVVPYPVVE